MVLLVHHGEAEPPAVEPMQPLSARGRAQVELVGRELARAGVRPDLIWHSGKLRAKQTAEAVWRATNPLASMSAVRGLLPADPPIWMRDALFGETRTIAVVGHYPHLPALLALLAGGDPAGASAGFPRHGAVILEAEGDGWREVWRFEP